MRFPGDGIYPRARVPLGPALLLEPIPDYRTFRFVTQRPQFHKTSRRKPRELKRPEARQCIPQPSGQEYHGFPQPTIVDRLEYADRSIPQVRVQPAFVSQRLCFVQDKQQRPLAFAEQPFHRLSGSACTDFRRSDTWNPNSRGPTLHVDFFSQPKGMLQFVQIPQGRRIHLRNFPAGSFGHLLTLKKQSAFSRPRTSPDKEGRPRVGLDRPLQKVAEIPQDLFAPMKISCRTSVYRCRQ